MAILRFRKNPSLTNHILFMLFATTLLLSAGCSNSAKSQFKVAPVTSWTSKLSLEEGISSLTSLRRICDDKLERITPPEIKDKIVPAYKSDDSNWRFSMKQLSDSTMFQPTHINAISQWEEIQYWCVQETENIGDQLNIDPVMYSKMKEAGNRTFDLRMLAMAKVLRGEYSYGDFAMRITEIKRKSDEDIDEFIKQEIPPIPEPTGNQSFFSKLGDAFIERLKRGGRRSLGSSTGFSTTSNCQKIGALDGRVYTFNGPCPVGYF